MLTNAADTLYTLHDNARASAVAEQVLALQPPAPAAQRQVAWTVVAHTAFEAGQFDRAEKAYGEVLALTPAKDPSRNDLNERLAASIYKQGEQARAAGDARAAADNFARVAIAAPESTVRASAEYDAAASLIALKEWAAAAKTLEDFRQRYPQNPLQPEVTARLALAYSEQQQWAPAAARIRAHRPPPRTARPTVRRVRAPRLWQSATLYEKAAGSDRRPRRSRRRPMPKYRAAAAKAYDRYVRQYPEPLEPAVEARYRLAQLAHADGNAAAEAQWMKAVFVADQNGGAARTDRTRTLGGLGALAQAQPAVDAYQKVTLVEPLAKNLKLKKERMEAVLKAYEVASNYGVAEVSNVDVPRRGAVPGLRQGAVRLRAPEEAVEARARAVRRDARGAGRSVRRQGDRAAHRQRAAHAAGHLRRVGEEELSTLRDAARRCAIGKTEKSEATVDAIR